jgi:hypothetical protein
MAFDASGAGAYYGGSIGGAAGAVAGSGLGPAGSMAAGLAGAALGSALGEIFDENGDGQLNYGEDYEIWKDEAIREGYYDMWWTPDERFHSPCYIGP